MPLRNRRHLMRLLGLMGHKLNAIWNAAARKHNRAAHVLQRKRHGQNVSAHQGNNGKLHKCAI